MFVRSNATLGGIARRAISAARNLLGQFGEGPVLGGRISRVRCGVAGAASVCALFCVDAANATVVTGTYTGIITSGTGTSPLGFSFDGLAGDTVSGTIFFDTSILTFDPASSSATKSTWDEMQSPSGVNFGATLDIAGVAFPNNSYAAFGFGPGSVSVWADETGGTNPANLFNFRSQAYFPDTHFNTILALGVSNNDLGAPYISDLADPSTISFKHQSGESGGAELFMQTDYSFGHFEFTVTDMSVNVPEPATLFLVGVGLASVGSMRRRNARGLKAFFTSRGP